MVALKPDGKWVDRPLVGKAVAVTEDTIDLMWYYGKYTSKWKEWGGGKDKKFQKDKVSRQLVLTNGFQLTSSNKLPVKLAKHLRKIYSKIDNK